MSRMPAWTGQSGRPDSPVPGREALLLAFLAIGLVLLAIQLWLLTVALEMYLAGHGREVWSLAIFSGLVFVGGLLSVWLLSRSPRLSGGQRIDSDGPQP
jgi:hypothetical protein